MMRLPDLLRAGPVLLVAVLAGCAGSSAGGARAPGGPLIVPAGGSSFLRFGADAVEWIDVAPDAAPGGETQAVPAGAGKPAAAGVDRETGWAAVAYEHRLAVVELSRGTLRWHDPAWSRSPVSVAVTGGLAAAVTGDTVAIYTLRDGLCVQREDLATWLEWFELDRLVYALPLSRTRFLLVGFRPMGLTSRSQAMVQEIDLGGMTREATAVGVLPGLTDVQACAYVGNALYVAGVLEEDRRLPGRPPQPGDLKQTLIVYRVEPAGLKQRAVVSLERHEFSTRVSELAVGERALSVILADGELLVFELGQGAVASQPVDRTRVRPGTSATWLEGNRLALIGPGGSEVVTTRVSDG